MQDCLSILERKLAMYVLVTVHENPGINKTKLMRLEEGNEQTKLKRIDELIEAGLLHVVDGDHWKSMVLELTDKGKRVLRHIVAIEKILSEE